MRAALPAAALAALLVLAACGGEEFSDLKAELNEKSKDFRGRVDPLPQVKAYEPVPYTADSLVDPFRPDRIDVAAGSRAPKTADADKMAPDLNRPKEPLEAFPLEALTMLGTISQNRESFALVRAGANLYRVKKGNYLGLNFGVVTGIEEAQINVKELVQDGTGEWVERTTTLQLLETRK
jgi:type IV pilus assembly protein PilP